MSSPLNDSLESSTIDSTNQPINQPVQPAVNEERPADGSYSNHNNEHKNDDELDLELAAELAEVDAELDEAQDAERAREEKIRNRQLMVDEIASKRAAIKAMRSFANQPSTPPLGVNTSSTSRALSFSSPLDNFSDGRPDMYKQGVSSHRRQTLSFSEPLAYADTPRIIGRPARSDSDDNVSGGAHHATPGRFAHDCHCSSCDPQIKPTSIAITVPVPKPFSGDQPNQAALQVELGQFLDQMERYITYSYASKRIDPTPEEWLGSAIMFLTGSASDVWRDVQVIACEEMVNGQRTNPVDWPELRQALVNHFGRPRADHELISFMLTLEQSSNESVRDFSDRFHTHHMELVRQELASRALSTTLYVRALLPNIRERVAEQIAATEFFVDNKIGPKEPRRALACLQRLAVARESALRIKRAASGPVQMKTAVNPSSKSPAVAPPKQADRSKISETIKSVPDALFNARRTAGVCGRCNAASHKTHECVVPRNLNPTPEARARANAMAAAPEEAIEQSKN